MKVSVITISFNSENTISETICSVNNQTYNDIEHVFIDGCSNDKTCEIIKKVSSRNQILISEKDNGIYDAMNKGIINSSGNIIFILNSDDSFYNKYVVAEIVDLFIEKKAEIVYGGMYVSQQNNLKKIIRKWIPNKFELGSYKFGWHTPHPGFVVRKESYLKYGLYKTNLKIASDFELMLRFMETKKCKSFLFENPVAILRDGGSSSSLFGIIQGAKDIKKAFKMNNIQLNIYFYLIKRYLFKLNQRIFN